MNGWKECIDFHNYAVLFEKVEQAYAETEVYPPRDALFSAFDLTPPEAVRVVILGQDPYHEPGQAHGLCFSVKPDVKIPPSLVNIYQEKNVLKFLKKEEKGMVNLLKLRVLKSII